MRLGGVVTKEGRKKKEVKQRRKQAAIRSVLWISTTYRGKNSQDMKNARDYIEKETKEQGIYIYSIDREGETLPKNGPYQIKFPSKQEKAR